MATIQTEENRALRKRVLDSYMRHLPHGVRDAMALFQMSEDEYRQRLEQQLFGPLIETTAGTTPLTISPERKPVTWKPWPDVQVWTGTVTISCPEYTGMLLVNGVKP